MNATFGFIQFDAVRGELYSGSTMCNTTKIAMPEYNSPCTASNWMKPKVEIIFFIIQKMIATFGFIQFDAVRGEFYSGITILVVLHIVLPEYNFPLHQIG